MTNVAQAILKRRSIRKFLPNKPVTREIIENILQTARRAPSGGNLQPWKVYVLMGEKKKELIEAVSKAIDDGKMEESDYNVYPPNLTEVYMHRRRQIAKDMYAALQIPYKDRVKRMEHFRNNWRFFDAPVGMIFTLDRQMEHAQFCDMGMLMQSIMLLAEEKGLNTCSLESWAHWPHTIARVLNLSCDEMVFAGMALGYGDLTHPVNQMKTPRMEMKDFAVFCDDQPTKDSATNTLVSKY